MIINDLRQLVSRYLSGDLGYEDFRDHFVAEYLSVRHEDYVDRLVNAIESECADFSEVHGDEDLVRSKLSDLIIPQEASVTVKVHSLQNGGVLKPSPESSLTVIGFGAVPQFAANAKLNDAEFSLT